MLTKLCRGPCGLEKEVGEFYRSKSGLYGRKQKCKVCVEEYNQANKESIAEYKKAWSLDRKEDRVISDALRYEANKDAIKKRVRVWARNNPDKVRDQRRRRRVALKGLPNLMPPDWWHILLSFYGAKCARCSSTENLEADHVIPITWAGSEHTLANSQILCKSHNSSKGNRNDKDYRDWSTGILLGRLIT